MFKKFLAFSPWVKVITLMVVMVVGLALIKYSQISAGMAMFAAMPEHSEAILVDTVREDTWAPTTTAVGTIVAIRQVTLRNEVEGQIAEIGFTSGQQVEEGQLLVKMQIDTEEAQLIAAEAELRLAEATQKRRQGLQANRTISQEDLERARTDVARAQAQVAALQATIRKKTITAPFAGFVGLTDLQVGMFVDKGTMITTLRGLDDSVYVDFSLPQDSAVFLGKGDTVTIRYPNLQMDITAEVIASEPVLDKNRTVRFRSIVHNVPLAVRPGAFVDVEAPLMEAQKALFVPLTAVRQSPQGAHVFIIEDDAEGKPRAKQRFVKLGMVKGSDVMITSGLKAGERIAADGSFKLFEGVLVRIKEAGL